MQSDARGAMANSPKVETERRHRRDWLRSVREYVIPQSGPEIAAAAYACGFVAGAMSMDVGWFLGLLLCEGPFLLTIAEWRSRRR
jgi:hypothetical protein